YILQLNEEEITNLYIELQYTQPEDVICQDSTLTESGTEAVVPYGAIPSSSMEFRIQLVPVYYNPGNRHAEKLKVWLCYNWNKIPFFKKTDAIIVDWDPDIFTYNADSFASCIYSTYTVDTDAEGRPVFPRVASADRPTALTQGGIGFDVPLGSIASNISYLKSFEGSTAFELIPVSNSTYFPRDSVTDYYTTSFNAIYRHNRNLIFGSVGFTVKGVGLSFNLGTSTDDAAVAANLRYKYEAW
ncbi:MAG: hypothetical protein K2H43_04650, partial [Clostridia bacterium]|nr:hypothetical protein [Clostridia bacterium]